MGGGIALPGGNEWMDDNLGLLMGGRSGFGAQQRVVSFVREGGRALRLTLIRKGKKRKKIWGKKTDKYAPSIRLLDRGSVRREIVT